MKDETEHRERLRSRLSGAVFYAIVDLGYVKGEDVARVGEALLTGGADLLQLRAKNCTQKLILKWGRELLPLCQRSGVPLIINDFPEIAIELGADGVHLGQEDGGLAEVKKRIGDELLVGRSTHSYSQAKLALQEGFDYIGYGPLYPTPTKKGRPAIGLREVEQVVREVDSALPVFCIGGIKRENLDAIKEAGARRAVVVSDVLKAKNQEEAVREILLKMAAPQ